MKKFSFAVVISILAITSSSQAHYVNINKSSHTVDLSPYHGELYALDWNPDNVTISYLANVQKQVPPNWHFEYGTVVAKFSLRDGQDVNLLHADPVMGGYVLGGLATFDSKIILGTKQYSGGTQVGYIYDESSKPKKLEGNKVSGHYLESGRLFAIENGEKILGVHPNGYTIWDSKNGKLKSSKTMPSLGLGDQGSYGVPTGIDRRPLVDTENGVVAWHDFVGNNGVTAQQLLIWDTNSGSAYGPVTTGTGQGGLSAFTLVPRQKEIVTASFQWDGFLSGTLQLRAWDYHGQEIKGRYEKANIVLGKFKFPSHSIRTLINMASAKDAPLITLLYNREIYQINSENGTILDVTVLDDMDNYYLDGFRSPRMFMSTNGKYLGFVRISDYSFAISSYKFE
jgi:hypothetical protein